MKSAPNKFSGAVLVCTDVAARGLDIPNVQNVLHYQCPFNAEIYVHRCGRTARIGKVGNALALLAPEDEKAFRLTCKVLGKATDSLKMMEIRYSNLENMRPMVMAAQELEKQSHRTSADQKAASWLLDLAKNADLDIDDDLKTEVTSKLLGKRAER